MLTHGAGILASAAGTAVLVSLAAAAGTAAVVGASVFGGSLILLYTASTIYHATRRPTTKVRLKVLDHCAIYVLIAGTCTPLPLVDRRARWGGSRFWLSGGRARGRGRMVAPLAGGGHLDPLPACAPRASRGRPHPRSLRRSRGCLQPAR